MHTLEARIEKLERENRRFKVTALVILALACTGLLLGSGTNPAPSEEVRTRALVVVDETGTARAVLSVGTDGPLLGLSDKSGRLRASLAVEGEGPTLAFYRKTGSETRLRLRARDNGPAKLQLYDETGNSRAVLSATRDLRSLGLYDESGRRQAGLSAEKAGSTLNLFDKSMVAGLKISAVDGKSTLKLTDENHGKRAVLAAREHGSGLTLFDEVGEMRASLFATTSGPALDLYDKSGDPRASVSATQSGPSLVLEDSRGYNATLGAVELVSPATGPNTKRSAASLVLFDQKKNVIWEAPN